MNSSQTSIAESIPDLIARQRRGHALDAVFYQSPDIFERDLERIFLQRWLYAGHVSQIPDPGDYFLFEIANESVIVVRDHEGGIRAHINVCRHRGSRICLQSSGKVRTFVCRYHGWTYGLAGDLRSGRYLPADFDRGSHGLKHIEAQVYHGLIFLSFASDPPRLETELAPLSPHLEPYRLAQTRVAHHHNYPVDANWKLAIENFMECYHCAPAHPEYARIHSRKLPRTETEALDAAMLARAAEVGLCTATIDTSGLSASGAVEMFYDRHALYDSYLTGTQDGRPVAPLLGDLRGYDGGAADGQIGFGNFLLLYSDHALVYSFIPRAPQRCDMQITWLVNESATQGVDYDLDRLTWLWDVTSVADQTIIDNNQKGVNSRYYEPGPYSSMESYASDFVAWYLEAIS